MKHTIQTRTGKISVATGPSDPDFVSVKITSLEQITQTVFLDADTLGATIFALEQACEMMELRKARAAA